MSQIKRRTGNRDVRVFNSVTVISAGDCVQFDENGEVTLGATNKDIVGIALEDATASTTVQVDIVHAGDVFEFPIENGTMAVTQVGEEADLYSADGLDLTETNNDVIIVGWNGTTTSKCYGVFKKIAFASGATAA